MGIAGVTLFFGSLVAATVLLFAAPAFALWETPPSLSVRLTGAGAYGQDLSLPDGQALGWVYVLPAREYIAAMATFYSGGALVEIGPGLTGSGTVSHVCANEAYSLYYPGTGTTVFAACYSAANGTAIVVSNATDLRGTYNVSLGTPSEIDHYAFDGPGHRLYVEAALGYADYRLYSLDLDQRTVVDNLSIPGGGPDPIFFDDNAGVLLVGVTGNDSLLSVDPSTGSSLPVLTTPGNVTGVFGDLASNRIFVCFQVGNLTDSAGMDVLNATTLQPVTTLGAVSPGFDGSFQDPSRGEVDFTDGVHVWLLNESTNQLVEAAGSLMSGYISFDPTTGQISVATSPCYAAAVCVNLYDLTRSYPATAPLSAFPYLGTSAPWEIGLVGVLAGVGLLLARVYVFYPLLEDPSLITSPPSRASPEDAAAAEAARQRWLTEDPKRGGPKR